MKLMSMVIHMQSDPLIGKKHDSSLSSEPLFIFNEDDVKLAVEFYKRYHNDVYSSEGYELLKEEKPDIYKEFTGDILINRTCICTYNYWLYEYCFKDVIE